MDEKVDVLSSLVQIDNPALVLVSGNVFYDVALAIPQLVRHDEINWLDAASIDVMPWARDGVIVGRAAFITQLGRIADADKVIAAALCALTHLLPSQTV